MYRWMEGRLFDLETFRCDIGNLFRYFAPRPHLAEIVILTEESAEFPVIFFEKLKRIHIILLRLLSLFWSDFN